MARDLDGLPVRCQSDFRAIFHSVARQYGSMLVDAPSILTKMSPHGILDDRPLPRRSPYESRGNHRGGPTTSSSNFEHGTRLAGRSRRRSRDRASRMCHATSGWTGENGPRSVSGLPDFYSRQAYARYDPADRVTGTGAYNRAAAAIDGGRPSRFRDPAQPYAVDSEGLGKTIDCLNGGDTTVHIGVARRSKGIRHNRGVSALPERAFGPLLDRRPVTFPFRQADSRRLDPGIQKDDNHGQCRTLARVFVKPRRNRRPHSAGRSPSAT